MMMMTAQALSIHDKRGRFNLQTCHNVLQFLSPPSTAQQRRSFSTRNDVYSTQLTSAPINELCLPCRDINTT